MAKITLDNLRKHNASVYGGSKVGTEKQSDVRETVESEIENFAKQVFITRLGKAEDSKGSMIPPLDVSLSKAISSYFGIVAPKTDDYGNAMSYTQREKYVVRTLMKQLGVSFGVDTLNTIARKFGNANFSKSALYKTMIEHSEFAGLATTGGVNADYRFIIPELILAAIRTDYEASSLSTNWIATTYNLSDQEAKMPQIKRGNGLAKKIGEGESIPFGSVSFGQKSVSTYKVGIGFEITDELIMRSSSDMLFTFLAAVGTDMSLARDYEAYRVLRNGEQANGSESAPTIGVNDTNDGFTYKDIKRATSRLKRLKRVPNRIILGEDDNIDLTSLPEFQGFNGGTRLTTIQNLLGVPDNLPADVYTVAANELMLVDTTKAMAELKWGGMKTAERENPQNGTKELFVSDWIGYAIVRQDARVVINKSLAYDPIAGNSGGFPTYMDIDARIAQSFGKQHA